jgi:hypothetical protein
MSFGLVAIARAIEIRCCAPGQDVRYRRRQADLSEQRMNSFPAFASTELFVDAKRFHDLAADRHLWIEGVERLLEDNLHVPARYA